MVLLQTLSTFQHGSINLIGFGLALINFLLAYGLGHLVVRQVLPVYVSRKILHISFYLLPLFARAWIPRVYLHHLGLSYTVGVLIHFLLYAQTFRNRSRFLNISFASLDREEDRPFSMRLLLLQKAEKLLVVNASYLFSYQFLKPRVFYLVAYFAVTFGDGLAEPVGNWIKSPKYKTYSLFATRGNFRTVAGSACVYAVTALLIIWLLPHHDPHFFLQLLIVPVAATLLEALSPKTLDNPFVFGGTLWALHLVESLPV
jgi:phytol kinase